MGAHSTPTGGTASRLHCLAPWGRDLPLSVSRGPKSMWGTKGPRGPICATTMCCGAPAVLWGRHATGTLHLHHGDIHAMGTPLCHGDVCAMGTHLHHRDPPVPWGRPRHGDPSPLWGPNCTMGTSMPWGPISTTGTPLHHWVVHAMGHLLCHGAPSVPRDPPVPMGHPCHGDPSVPWGTFCAMGTHLHCGDPSVPQGQPVPLLSRRDPTAPHRCHP